MCFLLLFKFITRELFQDYHQWLLCCYCSALSLLSNGSKYKTSESSSVSCIISVGQNLHGKSPLQIAIDILSHFDISQKERPVNASIEILDKWVILVFFHDVSDSFDHGWTLHAEESFKSQPNNKRALGLILVSFLSCDTFPISWEVLDNSYEGERKEEIPEKREKVDEIMYFTSRATHSVFFFPPQMKTRKHKEWRSVRWLDCARPPQEGTGDVAEEG